MSTTKKYLISLIEKAGKEVGSEYKLAQQLGYPQQTISAWKAGRRTCTPIDRAMLAGYAKQDPVQELIKASIDTAKDSKKEKLRQLISETTATKNAESQIKLFT